MGMKKTFKTLEEQIEILRSKGLVVNDEAYAKEVLLRENYFFFNGYRYPFVKSKDNKVYIQGTTFEEQYSLFLFDRQLRNIIFKNVLIIENNIKSIVSLILASCFLLSKSINSFKFISSLLLVFSITTFSSLSFFAIIHLPISIMQMLS